MKGKRWRKEEDDILKAYYEGGVKMSWEVVQRQLRIKGYYRSRAGISIRAKRAGIVKGKSNGGGRKSWALPVGTISIFNKGAKGYTKIKTGAGWECYAKHILKEAGRPVPAGFCIWYKDEDTLNCSPQNLDIITFSERTRRISKGYHERRKAILKRSASENLAAGLRPKVSGRNKVSWYKQKKDP
jgi:hypothetical protein